MNKWAIIGSGGFIAPRHKAAIDHVGDRLIATCDIDPRSRPDFTDRYEMYRSKEWKLVTHVAICTPNDLHYQMCKEATDMGKTVLCEKPLALSGWTAEKLPENVFTVFQLRHHPAVIEAKRWAKGASEVKLTVRVKRDQSYWHSWKGQEQRSGGILFNLGIHYFDLLIHLFGPEDGRFTIESSSYGPRRATGTIILGNTRCHYVIEINDTAAGQDRSLLIDGAPLSLSKADNLSFEDLHKSVYESLIFDGQGVNPKEAIKSIILVEHLKNYALAER